MRTVNGCEDFGAHVVRVVRTAASNNWFGLVQQAFNWVLVGNLQRKKWPFTPGPRWVSRRPVQIQKRCKYTAKRQKSIWDRFYKPIADGLACNEPVRCTDVLAAFLCSLFRVDVITTTLLYYSYKTAVSPTTHSKKASSRVCISGKRYQHPPRQMESIQFPRLALAFVHTRWRESTRR